MKHLNNIQDINARRQALALDKSFIVQAPAGSGKTELLIQRYLALLAKVEAPEEIIAITFTRKAAAQMRYRVIEALISARESQPPLLDPARTTWELALAVRHQDIKKHWELEYYPARLRIQTIDSLCLSLTRQMPLLSRFGAQPRISEKADNLYHQAAHATLTEIESDAKWSISVETVLRHLNNNWSNIENLLVAMLKRRDQWLRLLGDSQQLQQEILEKTLATVVRDQLKRVSAYCSDTMMGEWLSFARFAASNIANINSPIKACQDLYNRPVINSSVLPQWEGLAWLLLSDKGEWRKKIDRTVGFPAPSSATNTKEKQLFQQQKESFLGFLECLKKETDFRCALHHLRGLPSIYYPEYQWKVIEALFQCLPLAVAQLQLVFQEQGEVDFTEVSLRALESLGYSEAPTDLALVLDYQIRHLLIDEFQDTSLSQYRLLEKLISGWEAGDGRTLFIVGDPMQSIYRFREAEVGLYLRTWQQGIGELKLTPLTLTVNFRSQQGIVDWVNESFSQILPTTENIAIGAVPYSLSHAFHPSLGENAVRVHPIFEKDFTKEAAIVVDIIQSIKCTEPNSTIAILVRSRGHLTKIIPFLKKAELHFRALEIESLETRPTVRDLLALTKALFHPADRLSWLTILRAPWCGLILADLYMLAGEDFQASIWSRVQDQDCVKHLSLEGQRRLTRIQAIFKGALENRRRLSPRQLVEGVWLALGGPACITSTTALEEAAIYLDLLPQQTVAGDILDFKALDEAVAQLYTPPDPTADETLQIMTVHHAKGLEFDTVIIPSLGCSPPAEDQALLLWAERSDSNQLLLAPIAETGTPQEPIYQYIKTLNKEKEHFESGRLLYVAATRAKNRLHLLGHVNLDENGRLKAPTKRSLLISLWPAVKKEFELAAKNLNLSAVKQKKANNDIQTSASNFFLRLSVDWQCPEPSLKIRVKSSSVPEIIPISNDPIEFNWAGENARHMGTIIHRYLQAMAQEGLEHWNQDRITALEPVLCRDLAGQGIGIHGLESTLQRTQNILNRIIKDPRGCWILSSNHRDARNEYPLSGILKGQIIRVIIDRTFIDQAGVRWIVDYKTSPHEGGNVEEFLDSEQARYRSQLERYAALMSMQDPKATQIKLGLYYPQLCGWREWCWLK
ncbi:UvrD-helicase domain-containing protein [Candidatus Nitrosoglobus terrae]|nr:UvrD-helicase domain-containing protein [Candidatus Nitrosoglobus terrae]